MKTIKELINEYVKDTEKLEILDKVNEVSDLKELELQSLRDEKAKVEEEVKDYKEQNHKLLQTNNALFLKQAIETETEQEPEAEEEEFDFSAFI